MCGICGILRWSSGTALSTDLVKDMTDRLSHRGPDDGGLHVDLERGIGLGHRRLSIVDLSTAGHQPMANEDGTVWVTYNGEIYNHEDLRQELEAKGHVFRSHTDTEVLVHLYEEEGWDLVHRLRGMFAFGIWDARRRALFLARDRLGIKPLYFARPPGGLVFGSEIKAILRHPSIAPELDHEAFFHYLTFVCTPVPLTMFKGVSKLGPAERMVVRADGSMAHGRYWTPFSSSVAAEVAQLGDSEIESELLDRLRESIRLRMMADVPFGVFLSGGVDSSTNVALMSELTETPVRTFTVGFTDEPKYNELDHARAVASRFGTDHHEIMIDADDLHRFVPEMVYHQDEPIADWVCVPLHFVAKLARQSGTIVVQVGEGSDELFHGYDHYVANARFHRRVVAPLMHLPRPARATLAQGVTAMSRIVGRGQHYSRMLTDTALGRLPFWGGAVCYRDDVKDAVLANGANGLDSYEIVARSWEEAEEISPGADLLQKMTYLELKRRLAELLLMRVDKMTMATSVEARVPFLDHQLVEFAMAVPPRLKVHKGVGKYVLKRAVADVLPEGIAFRQKQGFGAPVSEWFRGELGRRAERETMESSLAELGLLDYTRLGDMWRAHHEGRAEWAFHLWVIYNVSAWHDYWVAGSEPAG